MSTRISRSQNQRMKTKFSSVLLFSAATFLIIAGLFILLFNLSSTNKGTAASTNDYRSVASGNWNSLSTWQRYNGSSWVAATSTPNNSHNVIDIRNGHTVTITSSVTVDQVNVNSGGKLVLNSGKTLTVSNGTGTDLSVSGTFTNAGTVSINSSATIAFQNNGVYQHNFTTTAGTIPAATWNSGSTCEIIGYTSNSSAPSGLQAFYNFEWNCPSQNADINLNGSLTSINGNFTVTSTGSKELRLSSNASTINVQGDFRQTGGTLIHATNGSQSPVLNIYGDFYMSGGEFEVVSSSGSAGRINVYGNWTHNGGTLTHNGTKTEVYFANSGTQVFSVSGNTVDDIDFFVNSGSNLVMGTNVMKGRNFTLSSGGTLTLGHSGGIRTSGSSNGNIQVSGTRTYSTGGRYVYNGTVSQVTGDGLPSTVYNLTINNESSVTLSNTVSVSNVLTLSNGKLITSSKEVRVTNTSSGAVTGHSENSYVHGNLRRTVSSSGNFDFPVGTATNYEIISVNLTGAAGFSTILGKFENVNPVEDAQPLSNVIVNGLTIDKMLDYGYWTLEPNTPMTSGTYKVTATSRGHNNAMGSGSSFTLLKRNNTTTPWQSVGTHLDNTQSSSGGAVTAARSNVTSFSDFAIGYGEYLNIKNPTLISGTSKQEGAIYLFPNVCSNVDAWIEIVSIDGGARLDEIDDFDAGYDEGWQPFVEAAPHTTSSILWKITFKTAGTSTDTILPWIAITGVDVDGNGSNLREFVEATMPYSYSLHASSILTVTNDNGNYRATSTVANVADIDTSKYQAMYQINYRNISYFMYRTGAISTSGSKQVRQNSMYFKSFFTGHKALPVSLTYFRAKESGSKVALAWSTESEINNSHFTIERSKDGKNFESIGTKKGAGNSTKTLYYSAVDEQPFQGLSYYRLKQTDFDGRSAYSEVQSVQFGKMAAREKLEIRSVQPNPFREYFEADFISDDAGTAEIMLINASGKVIISEKYGVNEGMNTYRFDSNGRVKNGVYFLTIILKGQKYTKKIICE